MDKPTSDRIAAAALQNSKKDALRACGGLCGCDGSLPCDCLCHEQYPEPVCGDCTPDNCVAAGSDVERPHRCDAVVTPEGRTAA